MGPSGLRSPHSQSCCGSWDCGSGRRCRSGCASRGCGCCSFRGCGPGWGSGCGSGWSSHRSSSWRKRRGWVGSRGWGASGHWKREKGDPSPPRAPSSAHPWLSLGLCPQHGSGKGLLPVSSESWPQGQLQFQTSVSFAKFMSIVLFFFFFFPCLPTGQKAQKKFIIDLSMC